MHYIELCIYKNNELIIKYNLKVDNLGHLKTIRGYLTLNKSDFRFCNFRYIFYMTQNKTLTVHFLQKQWRKFVIKYI